MTRACPECGYRMNRNSKMCRECANEQAAERRKISFFAMKLREKLRRGSDQVVAEVS